MKGFIIFILKIGKKIQPFGGRLLCLSTVTASHCFEVAVNSRRQKVCSENSPQEALLLTCVSPV